MSVLVMSLLAISLFASAPLTGIVKASAVYPCSVPSGVTVTLDGVLDSGEWNSTCRFDRELRGVPDNSTGVLVYPPFNQLVTLHIMQDGENHYLAWNWTHHWLNNTVNDGASSPDKYLFGLAFDFDHDRVWEDRDHVLHTIDDTLVLLYLGFNIDMTGWVDIHIPSALYPLSWNASANDFQGGLDYIVEDPGPLDRDGNSVSFPYGADRTPSTNVTDTDYAYTIELAVPNVLFNSPAGFGYGLTQETNFWNSTAARQENQTYAWSWPTEWTGYYAGEQGDQPGADKNPYYPMYLGTLADSGPYEEPNWQTYPYMFIDRGNVSATVPVGASHVHDPCGAAHTIDVVGTDLIVMSLGHYADTGGMNAMMDIQAAWPEGSTMVLYVDGNIITAGGPPVNYVWKYYNDLGTLPAYFSPLGTVYVPSTGHSHSMTNDYYQGNAVTDYAIVELFQDGDRTVLLVAGISGFATYYASQWLQQKTLDGTIRSYNAQAIILKLSDLDGDPLASPPEITVQELA